MNSQLSEDTKFNIEVYPLLYNVDVKGKIRVWMMERCGDRHRTIAGLEDGEKVTSNWKICKPKNVGKANETTAESQAEAEIQALYKKKRDKNWTAEYPNTTTFKSSYFKCMLANKYEEWPNEPVFVQPKLDGIRCLARKDGLWTRNGKPILSCPHIVKMYEPVFEKYPDLVIDGELYNHDLKDDFNTITSLIKKQNVTVGHLIKTRDIVQHHVYDIWLEGKPFSDRMVSIQNLKEQFNLPDSFVLVPTFKVETQEQLKELNAKNLADGYEGTMVRLNRPYENKRSNTLLKLKTFKDDEFDVVEIHEGQGNWSGYAKSLTLRLPDGRTFDAGFRGNQAYLANVLKNKDFYVGKSATIRFDDYTPDGIPRFGICVELNVLDK